MRLGSKLQLHDRVQLLIISRNRIADSKVPDIIIGLDLYQCPR